MKRAQLVRVNELNPHLLCVLCGGYYINATTIIECLHSFCKTCIVKYLESSKYCPICDVQVHKTKPLQNIRPDEVLQELVYKLVPGLYTKEVLNRRRFYRNKAAAAISEGSSEENAVDDNTGSPDGASAGLEAVGMDAMSISLEFSKDGKAIISSPKKKKRRQLTSKDEPLLEKRFLMCPANFTIAHLKKFIRMKLDLNPSLEVDVFHVDEPLSDSYALMDIAYIYTWFKTCPLPLHFSVFENPAKRQKCEIPLPSKMAAGLEVKSEEDDIQMESLCGINKDNTCRSDKKQTEEFLKPSNPSKQTETKTPTKRKTKEGSENTPLKKKSAKISTVSEVEVFFSDDGEDLVKSPETKSSHSETQTNGSSNSSNKSSPDEPSHSKLNPYKVSPSKISKVGNSIGSSHSKGSSTNKGLLQKESSSKHSQNSGKSSKDSPNKPSMGKDTNDTISKMHSSSKANKHSSNKSSSEKELSQKGSSSKSSSSNGDRTFKRSHSSGSSTVITKSSSKHSPRKSSSLSPRKVEDQESKVKPSKQFSEIFADGDDEVVVIDITPDSRPIIRKSPSVDKDIVKESGVRKSETAKDPGKVKYESSSSKEKSKSVHKKLSTSSGKSSNCDGNKEDKSTKTSQKTEQKLSQESDKVEQRVSDSKNELKNSSKTLSQSSQSGLFSDSKTNGCKISTSSSGKSIVVSIPKHLLGNSNSEKEEKKKKKRRDSHHHHKHHKHRRHSREGRDKEYPKDKSGSMSSAESVKSGSLSSLTESPVFDRLSGDEHPLMKVGKDLTSQKHSEKSPSKSANSSPSKSTGSTNSSSHREPVLMRLQREWDTHEKSDNKNYSSVKKDSGKTECDSKDKKPEQSKSLQSSNQTGSEKTLLDSKKERSSNPSKSMSTKSDSSHKQNSFSPDKPKPIVKTVYARIPKPITTICTDTPTTSSVKSVSSSSTSALSKGSKPKTASALTLTSKPRAKTTILSPAKILQRIKTSSSKSSHKPIPTPAGLRKAEPPKSAPSKVNGDASPMVTSVKSSVRQDAPEALKVTMPWMSLTSLAEAGKKVQESANTALGRNSPARSSNGSSTNSPWFSERQREDKGSKEPFVPKSPSIFSETQSAFGPLTMPKGIKTYSKKDKVAYTKPQDVFNPPSSSYEGAFRSFLACSINEDGQSPPKKPRYSLADLSPGTQSTSSSPKYLLSPKKDHIPTSPLTGNPRHLHGHKVIGQLQMVYESIHKPSYTEVTRKNAKPTSPLKTLSLSFEKAITSLDKKEDKNKDKTGSEKTGKDTNGVNASVGNKTELSNSLKLSESRPEPQHSKLQESTVVSSTEQSSHSELQDSKQEDCVTPKKSINSSLCSALSEEQIITQKTDKAEVTDDKQSESKVVSGETEQSDNIQTAPKGSCESSFSATHLSTTSPPQNGLNVCGAASPSETVCQKFVASPSSSSTKHSVNCNGSSSPATVPQTLPTPRVDPQDQSRSCVVVCHGNHHNHSPSGGGTSPQNNNLSAASSIEVGIPCDQCHSASTSNDGSMYDKITPQEAPLDLHKPRNRSEQSCLQAEGKG